MSSFYEKYHLNEVINASGKMTILGVSRYVDEAIEAQKFGGKNFFEMDQLNINVGKYLSDLIGAEDAQIVSSASAGIAQSIAAVIGKGSQFHLYHPYDKRIEQREIIIPKGHNVDFGAPVQTMIEVGGGEIVEAGYANMCRPDHVEALINPNTAAILYVKSHHSVQKSMLTIPETAEIAAIFNIPLIVDAAAEEDLSIYLEQGADLVIYSGAKALEGTSSGIVIGKKEYVEWVRMQSKGIGRAMKIGKENILGLAAAIERYLKEGLETGTDMLKRLKPFISSLNHLANVNATIVQDSAGRDIYRAQVTFTENTNKSAKKIVEELESGSPAIYTRNYRLNEGIIEFDIRSIDHNEMNQIIDKLKKILSI